MTAKTLFVDSSQPPPGFELVGRSQHVRASVFFMNQYLGFYYITIHDGHLQFHAPEKILQQLQGIKHKKRILEALNQPLALHIECLPNGPAQLPSSCEQLKEEPVYVIYNPNQESLNISINPSYFKKPKDAEDLELIPDSNADWSYMNKLSGAGSFSDNAPLIMSPLYPNLPNYYSLNSNNVLAYKNSSLFGSISQNNGINNGQFFQIQNLYAQHIDGNKVYTAGYMQNFMSPFIQTQIIAGAGFKTTLETAKNYEQIAATPLVLFIPQPSQVTIFKNEQLIYSQYLEAGYQRINTTGFPEGGYELGVKIGQSQLMHRFFSKGFTLPPLHAPQYYVYAGYLTNGMILTANNYNYLPQVLNIPVVQAGFNKRLSERIGLLGDVLINSNQGLLDFGPSFYWGNSLIKTAGLVTSQSNFGYYAMISTQRKRLNLNLLTTKIFYRKRSPNYFFLNNLEDNNSVSVSYQLSPKDLLGVQGNYNTAIDQVHTYSMGAFYQRYLGQVRDMSFYFNSSYNNAFYLGDSYSVSLSMSFAKGRYSGNQALLGQAQSNKTATDNQLALPTVLQGNTGYSHLNDQGIGYTLNEIHTLSPTVASVGATYNYTAAQAFGAAYVNANRIKEEQSTVGYGGNLETEMVVNQQGLHFNGVNRNNLSGITIRVNSKDLLDSKAQFALVDSQQRRLAVIPANKKAMIALPAYTDSDYTLINLSKSEYHITNPTRHITLYPGNIAHYEWRVEKRIILIGRMMSNGLALSNTWVHIGKNGIYTDSEGYFQLEVAQSTSSLKVEAAEPCLIPLPHLSATKTYYYLGERRCH